MKKLLVHVSPWILAAACTLLAIIITVFALSNFRREKTLMVEALLQKGQTIVRSINTGVRVSLRAGIQDRAPASLQIPAHVQTVIDQIHGQADIHFVLLVDAAGTILAASDTSLVGSSLDPDSLAFIAGGGRGGHLPYRMKEREGDKPAAFQVVQPYIPELRGLMPRGGGMRGPHAMMMERMFQGEPGNGPWQEELERLRDQQLALLVELDLDQFDTAVQRQLIQISILSIVLLLVGVGGWLSLLTLQNWKGSQQHLRQISAFNDILVESLPIGLIATDSNDSIQTVNTAAEKITDCAISTLLGKRPADCLPAALVAALAVQPTNRGEVYAREQQVSGRSGQQRTLLLSVLQVIDNEGRFIGKVLLMQDISEMKQLENELQRHERLVALGKMAAGVAHELRNPLSSIKGLALLLKSKIPSGSSDHGTADILVAEVERLNRSISELLDYTKAEHLNKTPFSLGLVLRKAINLVQVDASTLQIEIVPSLAPGGDTVLADQDKLNQVFLNLFLNAFEAMEHGGRLRVHTESDRTKVRCLIEDTGSGILPEDLPRIFDPYFTTKNDGNGLGLAMSAKIIEAHGGTIKVKSKYGEGSQVLVELPRQEIEDEPGQAAAKATEEKAV